MSILQINQVWSINLLYSADFLYQFIVQEISSTSLTIDDELQMQVGSKDLIALVLQKIYKRLDIHFPSP